MKPLKTILENRSSDSYLDNKKANSFKGLRPNGLTMQKKFVTLWNTNITKPFVNQG
jgi:hypothetical protein